jgi:predicted metalloprotease with PDZ domain
MRYHISRKHPTSQFIQIKLEIICKENEQIQLQLPAWRPGRYELANYAQKIRAFEVHSKKSELYWKKMSKDLWEFSASEAGNYFIQYEFYCNQMDAGGCWSDDQQLYLNFSNFIFDVLQRKNEKIIISIELPEDYKVATSLIQIEKNRWESSSFQHLMDSPLLAAADLQHFTYQVQASSFHIWIQGEIHFDVDYLISAFKSFTECQIQDFGEFPSENYHFIFQLLPYKHYHGVEHAYSTVITYGPAEALLDKFELDELVGVSSHELYHFWNVCRIRPNGILTYDLSKEVYLEEGLVMEGVTTYMGDYYLFKSGYFKTDDYLKILEKQIQREFDSFGWQNQSIVQSSFDLWLDGYKAGIPDKKVSIYNRGALISLCLDLMLKSSESSLAEVMKAMWIKFGKTGSGYCLKDFEELVILHSKDKEIIHSFFQKFVYGKEHLLPVLKNLLDDHGIVLFENFEGNELLHNLGIRINENGLITQLHPDSEAYKILMINDLILDYSTLNTNSNLVNIKIERMGRIMEVKLSKYQEKYFPKFTLKEMTNLNLIPSRFFSKQ